MMTILILLRGMYPPYSKGTATLLQEQGTTGYGRGREVSIRVDEDPVPLDTQHLEHNYCSFPEPVAVDNALDWIEYLHKENDSTVKYL